MIVYQDILKYGSFKFFLLIVILGTIALVMAPIQAHDLIPARSSSLATSDYLNHIAMVVQGKMALNEGQFPLRMAPLEQSGMGYPLYQFYSSTSYTIAAFIYQCLTPDNPFTACKMTIALALLLGGIYLYRLAYWFFQSRNAAVLASVVYLTAPYCICSVGILGAFNQTIAMGLLPAVVYYSLQRFYYPHSDKDLVFAALFWYLLITVHLLTFMFSSIIIGLFVLLLAYAEKRWRPIVSVAFAYGFACLLSMWYLGPVLLLEKYTLVAEGGLVPKPFNVVSPELAYLLSPVAHFNILKAAVGTEWFSIAQPGIGWPSLLAAGLCLYLYCKQKKNGLGFLSIWVQPLLLLFIFVFFLVWSPWNFWQWLPQPLLAIQETQRLLVQASWIGALLVAWAVTWFFQDGFKFKQLFLTLLFSILATSPWYFGQFIQWTRVSDLLKNPILNTAPNDYLIYFKAYPYFDRVDSLEVKSLIPGAALVINHEYSMNSQLIKNAYDPTLVLRGSLSDSLSALNMPFQLVVNHQAVGVALFKEGVFNVSIPLHVSPNALSSDSKITFGVQSEDKEFAKPPMPLSSAILTGFLNPNTTLFIDQVKPMCSHDGNTTFCHLDVPKAIQLVELPVLFYPEMLQVTLNGKLIPYKSVLRGHQIIVAVTPISGERNNIKVEFVGLSLANRVSFVAWLFWAVSLLCYIPIIPQNANFRRPSCGESDTI